MTRGRITLAVLATAASVAHADCPRPVVDAIAKAFPGGTLGRCIAEKEHGRDQFEARLVRSDGVRVEVDLAPDGAILQIEEPIAVDKLPPAVAKAFAAKYPKAKATGAEKQTARKVVTYEIQFAVGGARKEATFDGSGKLLEQE